MTPPQKRKSPYSDNPFVARAERATNMIILAGLQVHMREITRDAGYEAGSDHARYFELIREKIATLKADRDEKQRARDKDKAIMQAAATSPRPPVPAVAENGVPEVVVRPLFHPLLIGWRLNPAQVKARADMVQDITEMLSEGYAESDVLQYLKRTYGLGA